MHGDNRGCLCLWYLLTNLCLTTQQNAIWKLSLRKEFFREVYYCILDGQKSWDLYPANDSKILTKLKHHRVLQSSPFKHELAHPSMWVQTWPALEAVPFIVDGLYMLKVAFISSYHLYLYLYNFHHPLPFGDTKNKFNFCSLWQLAIQLFIHSFIQKTFIE